MTPRAGASATTRRRRLPRRAVLAAAGAAGGLGALALPWMAGRQTGIESIAGYQDVLPWVALHVVAAVASLVVALRVFPISDRRETERVLYLATAMVFLLRPIVLVVTNPTAEDFRRINMEVGPIYAPSWGIGASLIAAAVLVVAAVLTHRSDDVAQEAARAAARQALLRDPELAAFASDGPVVPAPPPTVAVPPTPVVALAPATMASAPAAPPTAAPGAAPTATPAAAAPVGAAPAVTARATAASVPVDAPPSGGSVAPPGFAR